MHVGLRFVGALNSLNNELGPSARGALRYDASALRSYVRERAHSRLMSSM